MANLLRIDDLPPEFMYPPEFIRVVELGLTDLEPWWIMQGEELVDRMRGLRARYPQRQLVPFARRQDNDDVACWDIDIGHGEISVIHDYASTGWEQRKRFANFNDWLRAAVEDLICFV